MTVFGHHRKGRVRVIATAVAVCLAGALGLVGAPSAGASVTPGIDDEASVIKIYYDCRQGQNPCPGHGGVSQAASPSEDGQSLNFNYAAGNPSYMGIYAYRVFAADHSATRFQSVYDFYLPSTTPVQALEFPMNDYINGTRYQWAVQWAPKEGGGPQWRIWEGAGKWQTPSGGRISATDITAGRWHHLVLDGNIVGGKVHYMDLIVNGVSHDLSAYSFAPTGGAGDQLVAAMQLDGDVNATPYHTYLENWHFYWA